MGKMTYYERGNTSWGARDTRRQARGRICNTELKLEEVARSAPSLFAWTETGTPRNLKSHAVGLRVAHEYGKRVSDAGNQMQGNNKPVVAVVPSFRG